MASSNDDKNSRSETPRTDALAEDYRANPHKYVNVVHENEPSIWLHARQLERDLAEAKAQLADMTINPDYSASRPSLGAKGEYQRGLKAAWDAIDKQIVRGEIKDPQKHEWRNGMVLASNAIAEMPDFNWNPAPPSPLGAPEDYKQKYLLLSAQHVREVEQQEKRIEELEGAVRVESACREQAETALAKAKSARGAPIRECLETTNEHIGRLIHAFDGDRKELLRKLYKMNLAALDAPTDDTAKETK